MAFLLFLLCAAHPGTRRQSESEIAAGRFGLEVGFWQMSATRPGKRHPLRGTETRPTPGWGDPVGKQVVQAQRLSCDFFLFAHRARWN